LDYFTTLPATVASERIRAFERKTYKGGYLYWGRGVSRRGWRCFFNSKCYTFKVFVYEYMADLGGKLGLKTGSTKEKRDLLTLLPKLEEVDAYNK